MTLGELEIGDKFYPESRQFKSTAIFKVIGKKEFNIHHGSATRICVDLKTGQHVSKSCRLKIIKK